MNTTSSPPAIASDLSRPKIIISSSNVDSRHMMSTMLEIWGYSPVEADGSLETVDLARDSHPKAILLDSSRVLDNDLELMAELRSSALTEGVPLVVLSGYSVPSYQSAYLRSGATEIMIKPVDLDQLESFLVTSIELERNSPSNEGLVNDRN